MERGVPFGEAHEAVGRLVAALGAEAGREVTDTELLEAHDGFRLGDAALLDPAASAARRSPRGGSFQSV